MRTPEICKTAVCLLLVAIASPAMAGPAAADDAASATLIFRQLNDAAIAIYRDTKQRFLGKADPVVIAGFSSVLIRRHGAEQRVGEIPAAYALLKTIDHVPRSLWAAVDPAVEGLDPEAAWRKQLTDFRPRVAAALNASSARARANGLAPGLSSSRANGLNAGPFEAGRNGLTAGSSSSSPKGLRGLAAGFGATGAIDRASRDPRSASSQ